MMKIGQFSKNRLMPESVQQERRSNTALTVSLHRCATLPALGAIAPHPAQPAITAKSFTFSIVPQKIKSEQTHKDAEKIQQNTKAVFKALTNCSENSANNFNVKREQTKNPFWKKEESENRKKYDAWRDSPDDLPKAEMEARKKEGQIAFSKLNESYKPLGSRKLIEILSHSAAFAPKLDPDSSGFRDLKTGLYCELHQVNTDNNNPEYVLCFPGTGTAGMDNKQWSNNIDQAIGKGVVPPAYMQAAELTEYIKAALDKPNIKLTVAGHSMGGGIANYVGLKHDLSSVCYNAAPLGGACLRDLGSIPENRLDKQLHIRCKGDGISSPKVQQKLQSFLQIWNKEKIWAPRNAGTICNVGKDFEPKKSGFDRHRLTIFDSWYAPAIQPPEININLLLMA